MIRARIQLVDRPVRLIDKLRPRPLTCEAWNCFSSPSYLVEVTHHRTIDTIGEGERWMCADHAQWERRR